MFFLLRYRQGHYPVASNPVPLAGGRADDGNPSHADRRGWAQGTLTSSTWRQDHVWKGGASLWNGPAASPEEELVRTPYGVRVWLGEDQICVFVPWTSPEAVFWFVEGNDLTVTNDFRVAMRYHGCDLEPAGCYSLLEFGCLVPPYSLCKGIHRVPPGFVWKWNVRTRRETLLSVPPDPLVAAKHGEATGLDFLAGLEEALAMAPADAFVYFSGGVDSSLIALTMKRLGRSPRLVYFGFDGEWGRDETANASRMAEALGLPMDVVSFSAGDIVSVIEDLGSLFSFPFSDFSVIPTTVLVRKARLLMGSASCGIDGTGADGAFAVGALVAKWRKVFRTPAHVRRAAAAILENGLVPVWALGGFRGQIQRAARRSLDCPLPVSVVAGQNTLRNIAYCTPEATRDALLDAIAKYNLDPVRDRPLEDQAAWFDLVHICAGQYAPKTLEPARHYGQVVLYPFMTPGTLQEAFAIGWPEKCRGGVHKHVLKEILARHVPPGLVYREKAGFQPPFQAMLRSGLFNGWIRHALDPSSNPLLQYADPGILERMFRDAVSGRRDFMTGSLGYLWLHLFMTSWWDFAHREVPEQEGRTY